MEDELVAAGDAWLDATAAELRKRGVGANEVAAYRAAAVLAMVQLVAAFREAARLPTQ